MISFSISKPINNNIMIYFAMYFVLNIIMVNTAFPYSNTKDTIFFEGEEREQQSIPIDTFHLKPSLRKLSLKTKIRDYGSRFSITKNNELIIIANKNKIFLFDSLLHKKNIFSFPVDKERGNYILDCFMNNSKNMYISLQHVLYEWNLANNHIIKIGPSLNLNFDGISSIITWNPGTIGGSYFCYRLDRYDNEENQAVLMKEITTPDSLHLSDDIASYGNLIYVNFGLWIDKETSIASTLGLMIVDCNKDNNQDYRKYLINIPNDSIKLDESKLLGANDNHLIFMLSLGNDFHKSKTEQKRCHEYIITVNMDMEVDKIVYLNTEGINVVPRLLSDDQYIVSNPSGIQYHYCIFTNSIHLICYTDIGIFYGVLNL